MYLIPSTMNLREELLQVEEEVLFKPCKKVIELKQNEKYRIGKLKRCVTKFGERIVADLGEFQTFFPMRYNKLSDAAITEINRGSFNFTYLCPLGRTASIKIEEEL
ncbi:uncharacterized protein LOC129914794 [Episyrphus balteatus]|uniref:uncharacterized protein LOC129913235 n=1 Tax=Episyrphus balteatus TaxID=286459 RepID=UPI00248539EC|nr:uncharacterized protein LOC129913235 [Episyrphus balteatus]XP_055847795.1 uncharacterized protein LOC129913236 [Episyrphus balteatus]XP_055850163.1 uncharacterized protein LOC129914794 [Episyrphus balteatus]XP_055903007.1 uncharacterized protein LOC129939148 [Eupeodes corollae]XP_055904140.1 uncharacterized protein LOC129939960 [Eupeodes corollae]XP_055904719.1 uncharacterized protein LOC129940425 [Eupeodes corollae]XP_055904833.1 uncharacterized protein LOC129940503 [Eupeodes corollae]XP